jgi:propanol-preferring alcohol dehydrogenase
MQAMLLKAPGRRLELTELATPVPDPGQILLRVEACAVCRTDLHLLDGELPNIRYPLVPGHQVVATVVSPSSEGPTAGSRVGVAWLGRTCGVCAQCAGGRENLCDSAEFTGYTLPGGYAEYVCADARYCFPLDSKPPAAALAPLLCAGLIGYRALSMCGDAQHVGIYGFGAAARVLAQVLRYQGRAWYAFSRPGDTRAQAAALELGASWAGASDAKPPRALDAALIFAPAGELVPIALAAVRKGGTVVCGGIHMSPIPQFPYALLWGERRLVSVANLTRQDGIEFLRLAAKIPVRTQTEIHPLADANLALERLRGGEISGSAVLQVAMNGAHQARA